MRPWSVIAAALLAVTLSTMLTTSPSAAATGSVSVSDGVFWNELSVEHPYSYTFTPDPGYTDVTLDAEVTGPDGYSAASDYESDAPLSGTPTITFYGEQMDGDYTLTVTMTACTPNYSCRDTVLPPQTFELRLPRSKTILKTPKSNVEPGQTVKLRAKVLDERPNGFFRADYGDIWLERRQGNRWKRVPGTKGFMGFGVYGWSVKYDAGRVAFRAVAAKGYGHDASVSGVVVIR